MPLIIQEVYTASSTATGVGNFNRDYIVLFNDSPLAASLAGLELQYAGVGTTASPMLGSRP
jgi:hypothetical protein